MRRRREKVFSRHIFVILALAGIFIALAAAYGVKYDGDAIKVMTLRAVEIISYFGGK